MSNVSDEELLRAYRDGDSEAFKLLFHRYRRPLFNFLLRRVGDRGRAEELYQDSWTKVIERCGAFRGDSKFSTWLYTIARNACIDHQRKMKFRGHASLDETQRGADQPRVERVANPGLAPDQLAVGQALRERIRIAVEALPEEQREVFLLRQLQGLGFREVAEVVGVPVNTVKSRMRYALERLQLGLDDLREQAGKGAEKA
ncbi:MAG: RNA polymerase sigma factor [Polyangiales bacterium]